ncbi:inner membrane protein YiaA [Duganella sp. PWIR1]
MPANTQQGPTAAFIGAAWLALLAGTATYLIGLWNASMQLNEKGYYFTVLMYGLFSAISLQKSVRDRNDGIPVTGMYFGLCWFSVLLSILLLITGLWNATLAPSEKGFYAMAFLLSLFAAVTVQKNVRDVAALKAARPDNAN